MTGPFARRTMPVLALVALVALAGPARAADLSLAAVIEETQPKIVKVYGAGGFRGLEPYQSGLLISAEGHVLTAWSYVLDTDAVTVVLNDGRRFEAELLGADPQLEIAVLKLKAEGLELSHFDLQQTATAEPGDWVLAFSNLYGVAAGEEPASVLHGIVTAKTTLSARRGAFETPYHGPIYVVDAMTNNPGAAGGALTTADGQLLGILGKELRNRLNNTWLNYAVPAAQLTETAEKIRAGQVIGASESAAAPAVTNPWTAETVGLVMVPDVLERTPPFIDALRPGSPATAAGLRPDDLIVFVNGKLVQSCKALSDELKHLDRDAPLRLTVMRGQELIELELSGKNRDSGLE